MNAPRCNRHENTPEAPRLCHTCQRIAVEQDIVTRTVDALLAAGYRDRCAGWVRFVYGNDGWDVISDYTTNLESILAPVNAYVETLCA